MKIIDMHCDTFSLLYQNPNEELKKNNLAIDLEKLKKGEYMAQCFAMFVPFSSHRLYQTCKEMIQLFKEQLQKNENFIQQAYTYQDLLTIAKNNKIAAILTIEEGAVIENDFKKLEEFYQLGVRMMTLTWNYPNGIGSPNLKYPLTHPYDFTIINDQDGLTGFGIQVVQKMNELGMIIDVSHLSDKGVEDVLKYSSKPFVASHSNARSVCNHCRNLSDDLIQKMAAKKCVIGINYYQDFVISKKESSASFMDYLIQHIRHIVSIGGIDVIGLGSDFDGIPTNPEWKDCSILPQLVLKLQQEGFTQEEIEKICYKNVLRIFKENLK